VIEKSHVKGRKEEGRRPRSTRWREGVARRYDEQHCQAPVVSKMFRAQFRSFGVEVCLAGF
jgi:hypothetical protein